MTMQQTLMRTKPQRRKPRIELKVQRKESETQAILTPEERKMKISCEIFPDGTWSVNSQDSIVGAGGPSSNFDAPGIAGARMAADWIWEINKAKFPNGWGLDVTECPKIIFFGREMKRAEYYARGNAYLIKQCQLEKMKRDSIELEKEIAKNEETYCHFKQLYEEELAKQTKDEH